MTRICTDENTLTRTSLNDTVFAMLIGGGWPRIAWYRTAFLPWMHGFFCPQITQIKQIFIGSYFIMADILRDAQGHLLNRRLMHGIVLLPPLGVESGYTEAIKIIHKKPTLLTTHKKYFTIFII
jgi:hypothetical protein